MKLLHTADWHLGKRLEQFSRLDEQKEVLEEICQIAENEAVNAVLIAGDIFDQFNPPTEAIQLFYKTVRQLARNGECAVIAIAGNHDSPERIAAPDPLARECGIYMIPFPDSQPVPIRLNSGLALESTAPGCCHLNLPGEDYPLRLILAPYANEVRLRTCLGFDDPEQALRDILAKQWLNLAQHFDSVPGVNVLVGHLFMQRKSAPPPEEPEDERSILQVGGAQALFTEMIPEQLQYAALGHLHRNMTIADEPCPAVYSGSPLAYSFSEADQQKFVVIVEAEPGKKAEYRSVPLTSGKKLLRAQFDSVDAAIQWLEAHPDTFVEIGIRSTRFLTAEDQHRLHSVHPGILAVIPLAESTEETDAGSQLQIQLEKTIEEMFHDYFQFKKGQPPNKEIMELFREVLASQPE